MSRRHGCQVLTAEAAAGLGTLEVGSENGNLAATITFTPPLGVTVTTTQRGYAFYDYEPTDALTYMD